MIVVKNLKKYVEEQKHITIDNHEYKQLEFIAHGGQAVVFKAFSTSDNEIIAFRVFLKKCDEPHWKRQKLQLDEQTKEHPFVQQCLRYHEHQISYPEKASIHLKTVIIQILRYAAGKLQYVSFKTLDLTEQKKIVKQIATALYSLHDDSLIHRDIKPDNILLSQSNDVMLSDLGMARTCDCGMKTQIGTPAWCAPEIWISILQGEDYVSSYDTSVDIWSFGLTVYYLFTETLLFENYSYDMIRDGLENFDFSALPDEQVRFWCRSMIVFDPAKRKSNWERIRRALQLK